MNKSTSIKEIFTALAKAQGEIPVIAFDKKAHNYRYATLGAIVEGIQGVLSKHGLAVVQTVRGGTEQMYIVTTLTHLSGEWIEDEGIPLIIGKRDMQGLGSAITYGKRYGICAMLRIVADEDDDGTAATYKEPPKKQEKTNICPLTEPQIKRLFAIAKAAHWTNEDVKFAMKAEYGIESTKDLDKNKYDELVDYITKNPNKETTVK